MAVTVVSAGIFYRFREADPTDPMGNHYVEPPVTSAFRVNRRCQDAVPEGGKRSSGSPFERQSGGLSLPSSLKKTPMQLFSSFRMPVRERSSSERPVVPANRSLPRLLRVLALGSLTHPR